MTHIKHSLQLQLSLTITALLLIIALISGSLSFYETYHQTHKIQDDLLRQIAAYINPDQPLPKSQKSKNDARIHIRTSTQQPSDQKDLPPAAHLPDGFHTLAESDDDDTYRVYIHTTEQGKIIIYQENEYRDDLAQSIAWHSTTPILATIPLAIALLIWQIRRALRPLRQQSQELQQRQATNLAPLNPQQAPSEIQGFIHAINQLLHRTHQAMQQQQRFIADAAHELRTPTTALSLQAERLAEHNLPPELQTQISSLKTTIARSQQLQEQLLTLARSQTNPEPAPAPPPPPPPPPITTPQTTPAPQTPPPKTKNRRNQQRKPQPAHQRNRPIHPNQNPCRQRHPLHLRRQPNRPIHPKPAKQHHHHHRRQRQRHPTRRTPARV